MSKIDYVNIEIGTNSDYRMSNGNTLPLVQLPFGMQGITLESNTSNGHWFYNPNAKYCEGIRITNQPSPWIQDYGYISFLPIDNVENISRHCRLSAIVKKQFTPSNIELFLPKYNANINVVPTKYGLISEVHRFDQRKATLLFDLGSKFSTCDFFEKEIHISVSNFDNNSNPIKSKFKKFYVIKFDQEISNFDIFSNEKKTINTDGENLSFIVSFNSKKIEIKLSSSFISFEQAKLNFCNDLDNKSLSQALENANDEWEEALNKIEIVAEEEKELRTFYSNMYRSSLFPHNITEVNEHGTNVYKDFHNDICKEGVMIADNGFWDTYKTSFPLFSIISPDIFRLTVSALINVYKDTGWLPRWMAPFEVGCMPSTLVDSVIAESITKNLIDEDHIEIAIEAMIKNAEVDSGNKLYGRENLSRYIKRGYISNEDQNNSVSCTLDYAYTDYVLGAALNYINCTDQAEKYIKRSSNYKTLFNENNKFFVSKNNSNEFLECFSPYTWGDDYCESAAWQNNFSVLHDLKGVETIFGGKVEMKKRLDEIFNMPPIYLGNHYNGQIHEQLEVGVLDLGQFAISNQPSFHLPHIYFYLEEYEIMMQVLKKTFKHFDYTASGYPGDEDNGSMSAWYILNKIGIYSLNPVSKEYLMFPASFKQVDIKLENGKTFNSYIDNPFKTITYEEIVGK